MKVNNKSLILLFLAFWMSSFATQLGAQTDDVYYDPSTDAPPPADFQTSQPANNVSRGYDDGDDGYDGEFYDYEDEYAYEYSSRVRRFHRPTVVYDYYDPFYTDLWVYDPFYMPGTSIYVMGGDYWSYRQWRRWNRWNSWNAWGGWGNPYWGWGWNSWGWNTWGGNAWGGWGNPWNNFYGCNNYFYDPYWTWNGCNPYNNVWVNNNYYYNNNGGGGFNQTTYVGPRRGGTSVNPGYVQIKDKNGRLNPAGNTPNAIELNGRQPGRIAVESDREPVGKTSKVDGRQSTPNTPADATRTPQAGRNPSGNPQEARPTSPQGGRQPQEARPTEPTRQPTETRPSRPTEPQRQPAETRPSRPTEPQRQPAQTRPQGEEPRPSRRSYEQPREESRPQRSEPQRQPAESRPQRSESQRQPAESRPQRSEPQQRSFDRPTRSNDSGNSGGRSSGGNSGGSNSGGRSGGGSSNSSGRGGRG